MIGRYHILDALARRLPAPPSPPPGAPPAAVVFTPGHLGDILHTAPMLRALREARPDWHTTWLVGPWSLALAKHFAGCVSEIALFAPDHLSYHRGQSRLRQSAAAQWRLGLRLRRLAPAAFVSTANESPEARWLANMLRPAIWSGMGDRRPPRVHPSVQTHFTPYAKDTPESLSKLALLRPFGIEPDPARAALFFPLPPDLLRAADAFLAAEAIDPARPLVLLSPGSGWPGKNWPADRYLALADALLSANRAQVAWLGTAAEASALFPSTPLPGKNWMGRLDLDLLAAVMSRATLWIGNDSGPMHLAAAAGCPTLSLWGPTEPAKWAPSGPTHRHIRLHTRCPGCEYWNPAARCLRPTHECMEAIPLPAVLSALAPYLP